jgi:hypothetical protein
MSRHNTPKASKPSAIKDIVKDDLVEAEPITLIEIKPVEDPIVEDDSAPFDLIPVAEAVTPKLKVVEETPAPKTMINVMIACCGMLRDHEVFRQINEGIVKNFGELKIEGVLLRPDAISAVPDNQVTRKAIEDGILILMPG